MSKGLYRRLIIIGIDNRTERTRYKVNYDTTYQRIFERVNQEAVKGKTKHLIIMLGACIDPTRLMVKVFLSRTPDSSGWNHFSPVVL